MRFTQEQRSVRPRRIYTHSTTRVSVSPSQNFLFSFSLSDVCIQRAALSGGKKKSKQVWRLRRHNKTANTRNKTKKLKTKKKKAKRFAKYQHGRGKEITRPARGSWYIHNTDNQIHFLFFFLSFSLYLVGLWRRKKDCKKNQALLVYDVALPIADPIFSLLHFSFGRGLRHFVLFTLLYSFSRPPTHPRRS